ncbi:glucose-6-phosphate isomerase [Buchnera aphidicola]|uniref:glucose-6-phosphate isomerase n=1 Tax=Buchnera aphidicola TaxID=9 RepID=UPI003463857A
MKSIVPIHTRSWKKLEQHFHDIKHLHLVNLFENDTNRFKNFSFIFKKNLLLDFSKNRITHQTIKLLLNLVQEMNLSNEIQSMFSGKHINITENRPVLHVALRNRSNTPIFVNGLDIMIEVNLILKKMKEFSNKVIQGIWKGYSGKNITHVVNVGIGGSHLGPKMVVEALKPYHNHLKVSFVSNIDSTELFNVLKTCDYETTIFLISSKTFSTEETITNFKTLKNNFLKQCGDQNSIQQHFFAITVNESEAINLGIPKDNIFKLWDWVGGRYSVWSAMGLSVVLVIGFKNFCKFLQGAYDMDIHFKNEPFEKNLPIFLALIGVWYNNFFNSETEAILPYDQYLKYFPSYVQQSNMESNGKNIDRNGNLVSWNTGPIIWGEVGTNGQHSFYQLIHQGTRLIPCDFITSIISHNPLEQHHKILLSNFFAQTHALAFGEYFYNKNRFLSKSNFINKDMDFLKKFKFFKGNQPSNTLLFKKMNPYSLGILISLYEHKVFTQGVIFNVFSFDQWGVELGKNISNNILKKLLYNDCNLCYESSTQGLIDFYNFHNQ